MEEKQGLDICRAVTENYLQEPVWSGVDFWHSIWNEQIVLQFLSPVQYIHSLFSHDQVISGTMFCNTEVCNRFTSGQMYWCYKWIIDIPHAVSVVSFCQKGICTLTTKENCHCCCYGVRTTVISIPWHVRFLLTMRILWSRLLLLITTVCLKH